MIMSILSTWMLTQKLETAFQIPRDGYAEWAVGLNDIKTSQNCRIWAL